MNKAIVATLAVSAAVLSPVFAREFNSRLKLKVFIRGAGDVPDRVIGFTPSRRGRHIRVPEGRLWYVRPVGALSGIQLDELARKLKSAAAPGLDLSDHWELSDESLRHLAALSHLQMLDLSRTRITDEGLSRLKGMTRLSILILPAGMTDRGADRLRRMPGLKELGLDETRLTDHGLAQIAHLAALESLDLSSTRITDKGLAELEKCPSLRKLTLGGLITDAGSASLEKLKALEEINISQTQLGEQGLAALARLPKLRSAALGPGITDRGLDRLSASPSLKTLDLSRTPVTDKGMGSVARLKTLEELALSQTSIGDAGLIALAQLPELRILDLSDTHVTSAGLAPLARMRKLEAISLSWQTLTREDLEGMSRLKQIRTIVLNGVPMPDSAMVKLRRLSPWEPVTGLGAGPVREAARPDALAMVLPPPIPIPDLRPGALPEVPKPSAAPTAPLSQVNAQPRAIQKASSRAAFQSGGRNVPALTSRPLRGPAEESALASARPEPIGAPAGRASKGEAEHLLETIRLQSNPSHAGAFSGLAGMRQLRSTDTLASLNNLAADNVPTAAVSEEDAPTQSLGEFSVGVKGGRR